jgi:hypothetical protein
MLCFVFRGRTKRRFLRSLCAVTFSLFSTSDKFHSILLVEAETENSFVSAMSYSPGQDMQSVVMVKLSLCAHEGKTGA